MTIVKRAPNCTYVKAEGSQGRWGEFASTTLDDVWGRLERFHQDRQGVNSDELDELAERIVTQQTTQTAGRVVQLADPVLLPWTAYEPGDTLTLNLAPKDVKGDKRVAAIVVSKGPQDAVPKYDVHFGAPVYSNDSAIVSGLRTLIREFKRPVYNPPVGATLPEIPPPQAAGFGEVTVVISAWNASDLSILKADLKCSGTNDHLIFNQALMMLTSKINAASGKVGGRIKLTEGDFYLGATVILHTGVRFEGSGSAHTILHAAPSSALAATNVSMFAVDHSAGTGSKEATSFSHMQMHGHRATQTSGTPTAIYFEPNGLDTVSLDNLVIREFRGQGLWFDRCAREVFIDKCLIYSNSLCGVFISREGTFKLTNNQIYLNTQHGISADGGIVALIGNDIFSNTLDGFTSGGVFQQPGQQIIGNRIFFNRNGIAFDSYEAIVADNIVYSNTAGGISVAGNLPMNVLGNICYSNATFGISLAAGAGNRGGNCVGNVCELNGTHGIDVASNQWNVQQNHISNNSRTTTNTSDGIRVTAGVKSMVTNNFIRQTTGAPVMKYGINITAGATDTFVAGNDARGGGFGTAAFVDAGATSVLAWAGAFGDNQP